MTDHRDYITAFVRHYPHRVRYTHELILRHRNDDNGYTQRSIELNPTQAAEIALDLGIKICDGDPKYDPEVSLPLFGPNQPEKEYMITLFMFWLKDMKDCGIIADVQIDAIRMLYNLKTTKKDGK